MFSDKRFYFIFVLSLALTALAGAQDPVKQLDVAVEVFDSYVLNSDGEIVANGKRYLLSDGPPVKQSVALIVADGVKMDWLIVRKVSGGRSTKLLAFEPQNFLFEHEGDGEYEVLAFTPEFEPFFTYFTVEGEGFNGDPADPGNPVPGLTELRKISDAALPIKPDGKKELAEAWGVVISKPYSSLDDLKAAVGSARIEVLSLVKHTDDSWNKYLMSVDQWFKSQDLDVDKYKVAVGVLVESLRYSAVKSSLRTFN